MPEEVKWTRVSTVIGKLKYDPRWVSDRGHAVYLEPKLVPGHAEIRATVAGGLLPSHLRRKPTWADEVIDKQAAEKPKEAALEFAPGEGMTYRKEVVHHLAFRKSDKESLVMYPTPETGVKHFRALTLPADDIIEFVMSGLDKNEKKDLDQLVHDARTLTEARRAGYAKGFESEEPLGEKLTADAKGAAAAVRALPKDSQASLGVLFALRARIGKRLREFLKQNGISEDFDDFQFMYSPRWMPDDDVTIQLKRTLRPEEAREVIRDFRAALEGHPEPEFRRLVLGILDAKEKSLK
jgi:hypothetical protein